MKAIIFVVIALTASTVPGFSQDGYTPPTSSGGGGGAVSSVFTRTGDVAAATNDYSFSQIGGFIQSTQLVVGTGLIYSQVNGHLDVDTGANKLETQTMAALLVPKTTTVAGNALSSNVTLDNITGLSSTGIIKRTGANTFAIASAGTDYQAAGNYVSTYTDSIRVGPAQFPSPTIADTLAVYIWQSGMSVAQIQAQRVGGTSDSVNVWRVRSGTMVRVKAQAIFTTTRNDFTGAWDVANADQNQSLNIGDTLLFVMNAPGGTPKNVAISVLLTKTR